MDRFLQERVVADTPRINPDIANGLATKHMSNVENYIDDVFRAVSRDFPEGLQYAGFQRCTPAEEYAFATNKRSNKRTYDTARSDIFLIKCFFKFNGELLPPRFIYLPFVNDGSFINISGSRFTISPVISDKVISLGLSNVFVRLLRDKLTFERMPHNVIFNGSRETVQVVWSLIYHKPQNMKNIKPLIKANCSLVHYLLCKYGFTETFKKYGNCTPVVGGREINSQTYPPDKWVICESACIKPKSVRDPNYQPPDIRIAIKIQEFSPMVKNLVAGFFYVADYFPTRISPHFIDNTRLWIILMGHILFSGLIGEGKLYIDVSEHFSSLDEYIDSIMYKKLKEINQPCENIYDLFAVIIKNFNDWIIKARDEICSLYGKELNILYFVLMGITSSILKLHFKLKKAASKRPLTEKDICSTMQQILKPGTIYSINAQHAGVSTVSYSGDNKFFEITANLVLQKSSNRQTNSSNRASVTDPSKRLHISIPEVAGYLNITKSEPSGRNQINPHVMLDENSNVVRDPAKIPLLDNIQAIISRG